MPKIHELVDVRPEVAEGDLHGIVRLNTVLSDEEDAFEKDAHRVLDATYATNSMRRLLHRLGRSLAGDEGDRKGNFIISGGYGSGKSHVLLTLYHLINSPELGQVWLDGNEIDIELPEDCQVILMPMMSAERADDEAAVDYLWQPIFHALDYDGFEHTGDNFPNDRHVEEALADRQVIVIIDEMERWYGAIESEPKRNANLAFLQNLTEYCQDPDNGLITMISLLEIEPEIRSIIDRVDRFPEDLTSAPDRHEFVLHRLVKNADRDAARPIIEAYIKEYRKIDEHVRIGDYNEYEEQMRKCYPFHPETIEVVFDRYSSVARAEQRSYQNSRGAMYLLAHVLRETIPSEETDQGQLSDRDLILAGDISLQIGIMYDDLCQLNPAVAGKAIDNLRLSSDVEHAAPVLSTILLHSIGEEAERHVGAQFGEILLGAMRPGTNGTALNANEVQACLKQLEDTAVNLHTVENPTRWLFTEEVNIRTQINRQARQVDTENARERIVEKIHEIVGGGERTAVYPNETVPDRRDIVLLISTRRLEDEEILEDIYHGRSYPNAVVIVEPQERGVVDEDDNIVWQAKRLIAARDMENKFHAEPDLRRQVKQIADNLEAAMQQRVEDQYGNWQSPVSVENGRIDFRRMQVQLDRTQILGAVDQRYTDAHYETAVKDTVKERGDTPPTVREVREAFYRQRSYPKPVSGPRPSDQSIDNAIRRLVVKGELDIVKGGDGHRISYEDPGVLTAEWIVAEGGGEPPEPRTEWIAGHIGSEVKSVNDIRAHCQKRAEDIIGKPTTDTKVDKVLVELVSEGKIEPVDEDAEMDLPLSPEMELRKKEKISWDYMKLPDEEPNAAPGALVTEVVQKVNKTDLLRKVRLQLTRTVAGGNIDEQMRGELGMSVRQPDEDTEVKVEWHVQDAPATNRDQLVAILKDMPTDRDLQVSLTLERQKARPGE